MNSKRKTPTLDRQGRIIFTSIVIIGYIVTFAWISIDVYRRATDQEIIWGILLGVIYIILGLNDHIIFQYFPAPWAGISFFSVQCALVLSIGLLLGVGGNVLIALPLVAFAVERLRSWHRFMVYASIVAIIVLPLGLRFEDWTTTAINGVTAAIYVGFIAVFVHLRENEKQAREKAEKLSDKLTQANVRLAAYATQAEELATTQERNRLAREIHDNLGHTLTVVNVQLEAARTVMDSDPERAMDALKKAQDLTKTGLTRVRESVASLRESPIDNRSLEEAILPLVEEMKTTGIVTDFKVLGEPVLLDHKVALALYRVAQEGLTNVSRHARASRVDINLVYQTGEVALMVEDNGVGTHETSGGFGLLGIKERMQLLGGSLEIDTALGQGFRLAAFVPLSMEQEGEE